MIAPGASVVTPGPEGKRPLILAICYAAVFGITLALAPLVGVLSPLGMAPLLTLAGAAAAIALIQTGTPLPWRSPATLVIAVLGGWGLISAIWALDPAQAVFGSAKVMLTAGLGLALVTAATNFRPPAWCFKALIVCGAFVLAILALEYMGHHLATTWLAALRGLAPPVGKSPLNRGVSVLVMLCWPIFGIIARRHGRRAAGAAVLLVAAVVFCSDNLTAKVALLVGGGVFLAATIVPSVTVWASRAAMIAIVLASPFAASLVPEPQSLIDRFPFLQSSLHHRLVIWHFAAGRIAEKPLWGWGFDAARTIPGGETTLEIQRPTQPGKPEDLPFYEQLMPLHPHNASLHVWLELGAVGAFGLCALLWLLAGRCGALTGAGSQGPAALAALLAGFVMANMSFGFWQSWWQSTLWIAAAACAANTRKGPAP